MSRRARRADGLDRARPDPARFCRDRRDALDTAWDSDADAPLLRATASTPATLAPQVAAPHSPANAAAGDRVRGDADRRRLYRRLHRRQARRPAHGGPGAARAARSRRACACWSRRPACATSERREREGTLASSAAMPAPSCCPSACGACAGYGEHAAARRQWSPSRRTARNFKGRMGAATAQVYLGSPYTRRGVGRARAHQRSARDAGNERGGLATCSAPTSTPTRSRPARYMKHRHRGDRARHCLEACVPSSRASVRAGDVVVGGRELRHRLVARAGAGGARCSWAWRRVVAASFAGLFFRNALQSRPAAVVLRARQGGSEDRRGRHASMPAQAGSTS